MRKKRPLAVVAVAVLRQLRPVVSKPGEGVDSLVLPPLSEGIAGVDEVGRGALFGPVVAAAVILPVESLAPLADAGVTDSKQIAPKRRVELACQIRLAAVDCKIGYASAHEIDRINILQASLLAMKRAIYRLDPVPTHCLIDGNQRIPDLGLSQETLVKGDQHSLAIAAASVIAKVWRDTLIIRLAERYPGYDLASNKGYGSQKHRAALQTMGPSKQHRQSFKTCRGPLIPLLSHR